MTNKSKIAIAIATLSIPVCIGVGVGVAYGIRQTPSKENKSIESKIKESYVGLSANITDSSVKTKFDEKTKELSETISKDATEVIKKVQAQYKSILKESEVVKVTTIYREGLEKLNGVLVAILEKAVAQFKEGKEKITDGTNFVKKYLSKENLEKIVKDEKEGLVNFIKEAGVKVAPYARRTFDVLKSDPETKDIESINEVIEKVAAYFEGTKEQPGAFDKIADELNKFDFSKVESEGYTKTFESLVSILTKAKSDAVAVLNGVQLKDGELDKIKKVIKPYYDTLTEGLNKSIALFKDSLIKLPSVIETLKN
ncbi:hypothetical protein [Metamycoplasma equirhinis]|uniref:hypothetical protein n=1 Tax=Metamycoplasma equirhinis TaxID=92402 RepID=UPI0035943999